MVENLEIVSKRKEIETLKKRLSKKIRIFDLIKKGEKEKAKEFLEKDDECLSYFSKFQHEMVDRRVINYHVISFYIGGWDISYNSMYESEVEEDLEKLKKEIEEKENRLEQKIFLQKQQEYIEEQREDIGENKKDRKRIEQFTFILAFGVIANLVFNWFQIFTEFQYAQKLHVMIVGGIFIMVFLLFIFFVIYTMKMGKQMKEFFFEHSISIITILIFAGIFIWFFLIAPNVSINQDKNENLEFFKDSFQEFKEIKNNETILLNEILENQNYILEEQIKINKNVDGGGS